MVAVAEPLTETQARAVDREQDARLARLIRKQFGFVWRLLRRVGVSESEADSAAQEVFAAACRRIGDIRLGSERSFLFSAALHVAACARRNREAQVALSDHALALEDLDEQQQAREVLGALLEQMPLELRVVFVLHELEKLEIAEIAEVVGIPTNVVSDRLTEAHEDFATHLERDSDYSLALFTAAREEQAPPGALVRALEAGGLSSAAVEAEADVAVMSTAGAGSRRSKLGRRSPFTLAAKWLALGWLAGLVAGSLLYALSNAAGPDRHGAAAH
ncbi:MAG: sigma-70 family RNA polymerase sigma factor [Polyangiaceae bacterium]